MTARGCLWALAVVAAVAGFGLVVLHKGTRLTRPQGDFFVFAHAGWAVRQGGERLYHVTDHNGWHYHYPPLFAILMSPLALPPPGEPAAYPALPPWAALLTFYLVNVGLLLLSLHLLALAAEEARAEVGDPEAERERWWRWRLVPMLTCLPALGLNLMRGQVQIVVLFLLSGMLLALVRNRRLLAGFCLGLAICVKVFPAYLLLVPLARRDGRGLAGCGLALVLGLVAVPWLVLGPDGVLLLGEMCREVIAPGLTGGDGTVRSRELCNAAGPPSQSFLAVLHHLSHLGAGEVPARPAAGLRLAHWLLAGGLTLFVVRWRGGLASSRGLVLLEQTGLLLGVMVVSVPVCHLHYLTLLVPLALAVTVRREREGWPLLAATFLGLGLPMLPGLGVLHRIGVPLAAALLLGGKVVLGREPPREERRTIAASCLHGGET